MGRSTISLQRDPPNGILQDRSQRPLKLLEGSRRHVNSSDIVPRMLFEIWGLRIWNFDEAVNGAVLTNAWRSRMMYFDFRVREYKSYQNCAQAVNGAFFFTQTFKRAKIGFRSLLLFFKTSMVTYIPWIYYTNSHSISESGTPFSTSSFSRSSFQA